MALSINEVAERVEALKQRNVLRDARMQDVLAVRKGQMDKVFADFFPESMPHAMVANFVDVAARDIAEVLAPLPSFNCSASSMASDNEKKFNDKRTQIANHYVQFSNLETQSYVGADWYLTYGFLPYVIEPDTDAGMPRIRIDNPINAYPEFDRYGRVVAYVKRYVKTLRELCLEFPEYEGQMVGPLGRENANWDSQLELIRYEDNDQVLLYLPDRKNLALLHTDNPMGKVMVRIARRPGIDPDDPRGQFDDIIWVQMARARFNFLAMEAAEKSVQAPLAVPMDVQEFAFGPDSVLRSQNPQSIRRVALELPTGAFTEASLLEQEMRMGARYPEGRSGQIDASIITGQGVQALLGGFDSQIKAGQQILADTLEEVIALCFEMDEALFDAKKEASGLYQGAPYKFNYTPSKDIKNDYTIQVRYGLMSGLDPSRALIFSLQALGAGLISRDFVMRELPWSMNVSEVQKDIDIEKMRDSLSQALLATSQAIPQMAMSGGDPTKVVRLISDVIQSRKKGVSIEDAVAQAFAPEEQPETTPENMEPPEPTEAAPAGMGSPVEAPMAGAPEQLGPSAGATPPPPDVQAILAQLGGMQ